jgi:RNA polymerase subunit RPABC4/transcription elongation factor Spt4
MKNYIIESKGNECEECGISEWNGKSIVFELEHKDGNHHNNERDNLEALCPNCHSITDTWKGRNKGSGRAARGLRLS